jgi:hypothetical protein
MMDQLIRLAEMDIEMLRKGHIPCVHSYSPSSILRKALRITGPVALGDRVYSTNRDNVLVIDRREDSSLLVCHRADHVPVPADTGVVVS